MKRYIYIASYQSIFMLLYESLQHSGSVVGLVRNEKMVTLLTYLQIEYIRLPEFSDSDWLNPCRLPRMKKMVKEFARNLEYESLLIFTHNAYDVFGFLLAATYSQMGYKVYFKELDPPRERIRNSFMLRCNCRLLYRIILLRLLKGITKVRELVILDIQPPTFGIDEAFRQAYHIQEPNGLTDDFMDERNQVIFHYAQPTYGKKILWVADLVSGLVPFLEKGSLEDLFARFIGDIAVKIHPRENQPTFYDGAEQLCSEMPAEFFFPNVSVVVSVASAALLQASLRPDLVAIALIDLLKWKDSNMKVAQKRFLVNGAVRGRLFFPERLEELAAMLNTFGIAFQ